MIYYAKIVPQTKEIIELTEQTNGDYPESISSYVIVPLLSKEYELLRLCNCNNLHGVKLFVTNTINHISYSIENQLNTMGENL